MGAFLTWILVTGMGINLTMGRLNVETWTGPYLQLLGNISKVLVYEQIFWYPEFGYLYANSWDLSATCV